MAAVGKNQNHNGVVQPLLTGKRAKQITDIWYPIITILIESLPILLECNTVFGFRVLSAVNRGLICKTSPKNLIYDSDSKPLL